jgi:hypothetical protein
MFSYMERGEMSTRKMGTPASEQKRNNAKTENKRKKCD